MYMYIGGCGALDTRLRGDSRMGWKAQAQQVIPL